MNFTSLIRGISKQFPEKDAVVAGARIVSFRDFWRNICAVADLYLDWGFRAGDRIVLLLPNSPEFLFFHFAALKAGVVSVPVKADYRSWELNQIIRNCRPKVLVSCDTWLGENRVNLEERSSSPRIVSIDHLDYEPGRGDDRVLPIESKAIASINYTYFGDGYPKGAVLTHANHIYAATGYARHQGFTVNDRFLIILPMAHVYALSGCVNSSLIRGGALVIVNNYTPKPIFAAIERHRVTVLSAVPFFFEYLSKYRHRIRADISSLRLGVTGGNFMPEKPHRRFEKELGIQIVQGYGLSECMPIICNPPGRRNKPGTLGIPGRKDIGIRIVGPTTESLPPGEVGEIIIKSPTNMRGYYRLPSDSRRILRKGWLHTGDLGTLDEEGYLYFHGMRKRIFNVYGNKVDPLEVSSALLAHPAVTNVEVFAADSEEGRQVIGSPQICARVALMDGYSVSPAELRGFLWERIAAYKVPEKFIIESSSRSSEVRRRSRRGHPAPSSISHT